MLSVDHLLQYGPLGLFLVAVTESVFFPIPPDLLLIPICLLNPRLSWWYAFLTSAGSVLGGLLGYAAGRRAGRPLIEKFFPQETVEKVEILFRKYGGWAVGIAAFTPIPFKVFTIGSGIFGVPLLTFTAASVLGRSGRFFLLAGLIFFMGERARDLLGRNFEIATLVLTVVMLLAVYLLPKIPASHKVRRAAGPIKKATGPLARLFSIPGFAKYFVLSALTLLLLAAFLDDMVGPESQVLSRSLLNFNSVLEPLVCPAGPVLGLVRSTPFVFILVMAGLIQFVLVKSGARGLPSPRLRALVLVTALMALSYITSAAVALFLRLTGFPSPATTGELMRPYLMVMASSLGTEKRPILWRLTAVTAASAIALGSASYEVFMGADPSLAGASLIMGAFLVSVSMAVVRYKG